MAWQVPSFQEIVDSELRDIANQSPDAYIGSDGDYSIRAAAHGAAVEGLYAHQQYIYNQIFPDLMDFDNLQRFGADHGVYLRAATAATGTLAFAGTVGNAVPLGTICAFNGVSFATTIAAVIGAGGTVNVPFQAVVPGAAGNFTDGSVLNLASAPPGISATASIATANLDGTDTEAQPAYLARVLYRLQNPPQGGSEADYYIWATNTPGCGYAFIYGQRTLANSVDIVILDANGNLPTLGLITAVQANINANRPVCANNSLVSGPSPLLVPISAAVVLGAGANLVTVTALIETALATYFATLTPKAAVIYNDLVMIFMNTLGVADVVFTTPTANVAVAFNNTTIQLARLGTVSIT
jgi:uncharacterized phage protein gp47/JayE